MAPSRCRGLGQSAPSRNPLSTSIPIPAWDQGKHYIYTIGVTKEGIKLIALVKKWKEVLGSGDATLDWD